MDSRRLFETALPESFPFYHLGQICPVPQETELSATESELAGVAFSIDCEGLLEGAILIVFYDPDLDHDLYAEAGNVIASRLATELSRRTGGKSQISPPRRLSSTQLHSLRKSILNSGVFVKKCYSHMH